MATQSQNCNNWTSVTRTGDSGISHIGISTALQTDDANFVRSPASDQSTCFKGAPPADAVGCPAPYIQCQFPAFSLPVTDVITAAQITVKHKQGIALIDGGTVQFEDTGTTLSTSQTTETYNVLPSLFTIASLNAATATYNLPYKGVGSIHQPVVNGIPAPFVGLVTLTITTTAPPTSGMLDNVAILIPSIGVKIN